jgi:hypothetical protein
MESLQNTIYRGLNSPPTNDHNASLSTEVFQPLLQCALLPRIIQAYILGKAERGLYNPTLLDIRLLLDISWADLRAVICPLRHIVGQCADPEAVCRLLWFVAQRLSPEIAIRQLSLELAQGCIRLKKDTGKQHWCDVQVTLADRAD